jgi:hypothetical protein
MRSMDHQLLAALWHDLDGPAAALTAVSITGREHSLPSAYEVSALASASVAAATLAVAEFQAVRSGQPIRAVTVERTHAAVAFACERYLTPLGWRVPDAWDPLAGDYACRDGFIRLHTNYTYHRDAVLRVLGEVSEREQLQHAVLGWDGEALESAVVAAGGCAAVLRSPAAWREHPQGRALATEPLFARQHWACAAFSDLGPVARPLQGVRVLDLTRVIAGPIATRLLAAYGADVLRIDPPGFAEVPALLCDITAGKRRAALDLRAAPDRERFERLVAAAHVIVHGLRADALASLGYDTTRLRQLNPNVAIVTHDAYGFSGPWSTRRGFDSLVQMSCGIAWRGREVLGGAVPRPLPVQALDHATGYLLAACACRALTRRSSERQATLTRTSLARVAWLLQELGDSQDPHAPGLDKAQLSPFMEEATSALGPLRRVRCPGHIEGSVAHWTIPAGPLGSDAAAW